MSVLEFLSMSFQQNLRGEKGGKYVGTQSRHSHDHFPHPKLSIVPRVLAGRLVLKFVILKLSRFNNYK